MGGLSKQVAGVSLRLTDLRLQLSTYPNEDSLCVGVREMFGVEIRWLRGSVVS